MKKKLKIKDDPIHRVLKIEGINYSYEFFIALGRKGLPVGEAVKIISRENGVIFFEKIQE
jgi:hypothetical protein